MSTDRKDLKIQALLEKISSLTMHYENQIADLRVDLTISSQEVEELRAAQEQDVEELDEKQDPTAD